VLEGSPCFLGVDSGSTTTKVVLIDSSGNIAYEYYANNRGDPIEAVKEGIAKLRRLATETGTTLSVSRSAVTGYGESHPGRVRLMKASWRRSLIATAGKFRKDVTFILDIGGAGYEGDFH
jgi:activator of 2-hydroxyglutaryl-CoA dehydratase